MQSNEHEPSDGSVTRWIRELKNDESQAINELWNRFSTRLAKIAQKKLFRVQRTVANGETIASDAMAEFFRNFQRFERLTNRVDLWKILLRIADCRAKDEIRRVNSAKRGGQELVFNEDSDGIDLQHYVENNPFSEMCLLEEYQARLDSLDDPILEGIAVQRMMGYSNEEIGKQLQLSARSIERKVKIIREKWFDCLNREQSSDS